MQLFSMLSALIGQKEDACAFEQGPATILAGITVGTFILIICNLRLLIQLRRGERGFSISPFPLIFGFIALWGVVSKDVLLFPEWNWFLAKLMDIFLVTLVVIFWESWEYFVNRIYRREQHDL
jgi:hypothetical protein